jgi:catechol 2,3-dioxygenase-like lactoylglutathione lyase family enzyme
MTIQRMEHVGIVVDDLAAATAFFVELGLKRQGEGKVEGDWVDRVVGLEGIQVDFAMLETPDGDGLLELVKFHSPSVRGGDGDAPANTLGLRHLAFAVDDLDAAVANVRASGGELVGEVENYQDPSALLRPWPGEDHHRTGGEDRLRASGSQNRTDSDDFAISGLRRVIIRDPEAERTQGLARGRSNDL